MDVSLFSSYWEITSTGGTTTASVYSTTAATTIGVVNGGTYSFRFNASTGALDYSTNGGTYTSLATGLTSGPYFVYVSTAASTTASLNCGQRPFTNTIATGYKALNTQNFPAPAIVAGNAYMDATLYTGNAGSQSIVNSGAMQPDLVWAKARSQADQQVWMDSVRGVAKRLYSNLTNAEDPTGGLASVNSNGFSLNSSSSSINNSGQTYVGWQWKEGATPGFDIVAYTGTGVARTVAHTLGVAPSMIFTKNRTTGVANWLAYHSSLGATNYLLPNTTAASAASAAPWNNTAPTSSVFTVGTSAASNESGSNMIAYLWAPVAGFSKFGSYSGNGSADGTFVYLGFRPKWVMVKRFDAATFDWVVLDSSRGQINVNNLSLLMNGTPAEVTGTYSQDFLSNGFKMRDSGGGQNASGGTYIYAAFAENPFKYALAR
jgi:hypothetical protein